jgi:hypothetical protein
LSGDKALYFNKRVNGIHISLPHDINPRFRELEGLIYPFHGSISSMD